MTGRSETLQLAQDALLVAFVAAVMVTDWRWQKIPNLATYPAMAVGLALAVAEGVPGAIAGEGLLDHVVALAAAFFLTLPLYATGGLKAGDVKLLMAVGALEGLLFLFYAAVFGAILGGLYAVALVATRRVVSGQSFREALRAFMPYGVALGAGALVTLATGVAR